MNELPVIDKSWTLFLDRDGVINERIPDDYVKSPREFIFKEGFLEAIKTLAALFGRIVVVTNQRGIARKIMSEEALDKVHDFMIQEIISNGGRIDAIYHCPHDRNDDCECRKPKTGMALSAKRQFPDIEFQRSIIAGDSLSDMKFGENAGMTCVLIRGKENTDTYLSFDSLFDFSRHIVR